MPPARRRRRTSPRLLVILVLAWCVLLSSCSDDGDGGERKRAAKGSAVVRSPLTGLPIKGKAPTRPVLAVKIDNSSNSAPQLGMGSADLVAEELVEGGITRLAVFFHTDLPATVGPVRSMRATDIGIVQPLDAVLVASGGAPPTLTRVEDAGITTFTEGAAGFFRDGSRVAPYNLFMRLADLVRGMDEAGDPPPVYLPFSDDAADAQLPEGEPAAGLSATFSPSSTTTFELREGRYVNTDTYASPDDQFQADTVLVLRVRVGDAGYLDPAGNPVPETIFEGQGEAMVFHDGRVVRGTWTKAGLDAGVRLRSGGSAVTLPPGKVWIELVPAEGGSVTVTP